MHSLFVTIQYHQDINRGLCTKNSFHSGKAKMIEKLDSTGVNKDFQTIFNAAEAKNMNHTKVSDYFA